VATNFPTVPAVRTGDEQKSQQPDEEKSAADKASDRAPAPSRTSSDVCTVQ
jgi:hypothetical protein